MIVKPISRQAESEFVERLIEKTSKRPESVSLYHGRHKAYVSHNGFAIDMILVSCLSPTLSQVCQKQSADMFGRKLNYLVNPITREKVSRFLADLDESVVLDIADCLFCSALYHDSGGFIVPFGMIRLLPEGAIDRVAIMQPWLTFHIMLGSVSDRYGLDVPSYQPI